MACNLPPTGGALRSDGVPAMPAAPTVFSKVYGCGQAKMVQGFGFTLSKGKGKDGATVRAPSEPHAGR